MNENENTYTVTLTFSVWAESADDAIDVAVEALAPANDLTLNDLIGPAEISVTRIGATASRRIGGDC